MPLPLDDVLTLTRSHALEIAFEINSVPVVDRVPKLCDAWLRIKNGHRVWEQPKPVRDQMLKIYSTVIFGECCNG